MRLLEDCWTAGGEGRWWLGNPSGEGTETRVRESEVESVWVRLGSPMV